MKSGKDKNDSGLEAVVGSESEEIYRLIIEELAPVLIVKYGLDDLCIEDPNQALIELIKIFDDPEFSLEKIAYVVDDFLDAKERILTKLEYLNEDDPNEILMILFYAVSSFESMLNFHLHDELKTKNLSEDDIESILKLSVDAKLGWLLKLICGSGYTENENWPILKKFVRARNFFIHYKPVTWEKYDNNSDFLNKESFNNFLDAAYNCHFYLKECHTEVYNDNHRRIELIKTLIKNRH